MSWLALLRIAMGLWLLYMALDVGGRHPQPAVIQAALWSGSLALIFGALTRLAAAILFALAIYFIHLVFILRLFPLLVVFPLFILVFTRQFLDGVKQQ